MDINEVKNKYKNFEFVGVPFEFKQRTLIRAKHLAMNEMLHYYSFEEDFFWQANPYGKSDMDSDIPDFFMS